jgi:hypothetical protein
MRLRDSHEKQSGTGGTVARLEFPEHATTGHWKLISEVGSFPAHEVAVQPRVSDQQQHAVQPAIAKLQIEPSRERLEVPRRGLRFDTESPTRPSNGRVPRPRVADDREGNLGRPAEGVVNE